MELADVRWDPSSNTLSGVSLGPAATAHDVAIYVPGPYRLDTARPEYFHESGEYSLRQAGPNLLLLRVRFDKDTATKWQVKFASGS
jgi:hypothetical protein